MGRLLVLGATLALAGCATALSDAGRTVEILTASPAPAVMDSLVEVGVLTCERGGALEVGSLEKNVEACRNELRNKAAERGASVVVVDGADVRVSGLCDNCVVMVGVAYRKRQSQGLLPPRRLQPARRP